MRDRARGRRRGPPRPSTFSSAEGLGQQSAVADQQPRFAFDRVAEAARPAGQGLQIAVSRPSRVRTATRPPQIGRVLADHRVLDGVGDDEDDDQLEDRHLADLALARDAQDHDQEQVDDRGPNDDLGQARADARAASSDRLPGGRCGPHGQRDRDRDPDSDEHVADAEHVGQRQPAGSANRSVSGPSAGSATTMLFDAPAGSPPTEASALASAGIQPPLATIAARLHAAPIAISATPGIATLRRTAIEHDGRRGDVDGRARVTDEAAERIGEDQDLDGQPDQGQRRPAQPQRAEPLEAATRQVAGDDPDRDRVEDEHRRVRIPGLCLAGSRRAGPRGPRGGRR